MVWQAIGAIGGAIAGGLLEGDAQEDANKANAEQAQINRDWQEKQISSARDYNTMMSNTAHQREVADMKAAGINPMLSVMGGSGASSPSSPTGSGAQATASPVTGPGRAVSGAFASALQAEKIQADLKNVDKDTLLKEASALAAGAAATRDTATAGEATERTIQMARGRSAAAAEADAKKNKAALDLQYQAAERLMGTIRQGAGIATDAIGGHPIRRWIPNLPSKLK